MNQTQIITAGILAFIVLCVLCVSTHLGIIEESFSKNPVTALRGSPELTMTVRSGKVTLRGRLPDDQLRAALVSGAEQAYGRGNTIDSLTLDPQTARPEWLSSIASIPRLLGRDIENGAVTLHDSTITVRGEVASQRRKQTILSDAAGLSTVLRVKDELTVVRPPPPEAQPQPLQAQIDAMLKSTQIDFETNSARLTPASAALLDRIAVALNRSSQSELEVGGHTDAEGPERFNRVLSQRRADAVRQYLVRKGVRADRIRAVGYGATRPLSKGTTPEDLRRNRRVEITVKE